MSAVDYPDAVIENVAWLVSVREWPERIPARVGWVSMAALERWLWYHDRDDLANYLDDRRYA